MAKRSKKQVSEFGDQNSKPQGANVEEKMQKTTAVQTNQANPNGESLTEMHHQQQQNQVEPVVVDPVVTTTVSSTTVPAINSQMRQPGVSEEGSKEQTQAPVTVSAAREPQVDPFCPSRDRFITRNEHNYQILSSKHAVRRENYQRDDPCMQRSYIFPATSDIDILDAPQRDRQRQSAYGNFFGQANSLNTNAKPAAGIRTRLQ